MYRKHLRMARGEGEVGSSGLKSHFVERVVKLPMVHVAWDYATNTYTHIKESNRLVNFTLTNAERSMTFVAGQARPVVLKFEKQIQAVDDLACKGLGTLEEKVPFITKPPEQIIGDTRKLYTSTVYSGLEGIRSYGNNKVKSVTDYGLRKAVEILNSPLVKSLVTSVDGALVVTENCIDYILPPVDIDPQNDVRKEKSDENRTVLSRLGHVSSTVRHRVYRNLVIKVHNIRIGSLELLNIPTKLIQHTLDNVDAVNQYAKSLWEALSRDEPSEKQTDKLQQLLRLSRPLVKQLEDMLVTFLSILPLPSPKEKAETNNISDEVAQAPVVVNAVRDSILWVVGVIHVIPSLLPMYLYALSSWLEKKRESKGRYVREKIQNGDNYRETNNDISHVKPEQNHNKYQD